MGREGSDRAEANREAPPENVQQALARARRHTQNALAEALQAARALLDAASLGISGRPSAAHRGLSELSRSLDELSAAVAGERQGLPEQLAAAILDALDHEIRRWEQRSQDDAEARAVLRAFLGLREILWELGVRSATAEPPQPDAEKSARADAEKSGRPVRRRRAQGRSPDESATNSDDTATPRVQRVRVEG